MPTDSAHHMSTVDTRSLDLTYRMERMQSRLKAVESNCQCLVTKGLPQLNGCANSGLYIRVPPATVVYGSWLLDFPPSNVLGETTSLPD